MAGGGDGSHRISSTEVLASTSSAWVLANSLPRSLQGLRGVTIANSFFITGEYNIVGWGTDNILVQVDMMVTIIETRCTNGTGRTGWKLGR